AFCARVSPATGKASSMPAASSVSTRRKQDAGGGSQTRSPRAERRPPATGGEELRRSSVPVVDAQRGDDDQHGEHDVAEYPFHHAVLPSEVGSDRRILDRKLSPQRARDQGAGPTPEGGWPLGVGSPLKRSSS